MKNNWHTWLIIFSTLLLSAACKLVQPVFNVTFETKGGLIEVSIVGVDRETGEQAVKAIEEDFAYLDQHWRVGGGGDLDRVNSLLPAGKVITAPPSLLPLLGLSQRFATSSSGLFDPAIGGFLALWGFNAPHVESRPPPSVRAITALLHAKPKMRDLDQDGVVWRSNNPAVQLDFSSLLRGYGIDLAIARLREFGLRNAKVKFGGAIRVIGTRDGQSWSIPIHRHAGGSILAFIELSGDESMVNLGNNERSFLYHKIRYHELIDPRTGYPVTHTKAVTVLYKNAVTADAAAHALFIAGPNEWAKIAHAMEINQALLIDNHNILYATPAMAQRLKILGKIPNIVLIDTSKITSN